jgi:hypothetical protein
MALSFIEKAEAILDQADDVLSKLSNLSVVLKTTPMLSPPSDALLPLWMVVQHSSLAVSLVVLETSIVVVYLALCYVYR